MSQTAQFLWIGETLSKMEMLCLSSFIRTGYNVQVYCYGELDLPAGVIQKNAADILPYDQVFTYRAPGFGCGSFAGFADRFRYHLLYEKGGWWFDMDFVSIRIKSEPND